MVVVSARVHVAAAATSPSPPAASRPTPRRRVASTPIPAETIANTRSTPAIRTALSAVPNQSTARSFSHVGTRSMKASPTAITGVAVRPRNPATSSATPRPSAAAAIPARAPAPGRCGCAALAARRRGVEHVSILRQIGRTAASDQVTKVLRPGVDPSGERPADAAAGRSEGAAAVTDGVLLGRRHLGRGPGVAVGNEDRVVAEAVGASRLADQPPADPTLFDDDARPVGVRQGGRADEAPRRADRRARRRAGAATRSRLRRVVTVPTRPAGRQDARHAAEGVDTETGVVGDRTEGPSPRPRRSP